GKVAGDGFRVGIGEFPETFARDVELDLSPFARGPKRAAFVGVELFLVDRPKETFDELPAGAECGGTDPEASADPAADVGRAVEVLPHLPIASEDAARKRRRRQLEILHQAEVKLLRTFDKISLELLPVKEPAREEASHEHAEVE